ncbi:MAG: L,D-transpeptidase family protein [Xanthomonadales bacterium]|nr:L,D-transpeptidase family protein [Xanthomonadales bacterium]
MRPTPCLALFAALALAACAGSVRPPTTPAAPATTSERPPLASESPIANADQLIVVSSQNWDATVGEMHRFERHGTLWQEIGHGSAVSLGRNGTAWGLGLHAMPQPGPQKVEGDGRSPAGVFTLTGAFGNGPAGHTLMPYDAMDASDWCMDVPQSPYYNRIVDARDIGEASVAGSTEPMRLDLHRDGDIRYALGLVVAHNPQAIPNKGSCIFMHLWRQPGEATSGCTAMDEEAMQTLFAWLDPARNPVLLVLPEAEYARLSSSWRLPRLELLQ